MTLQASNSKAEFLNFNLQSTYNKGLELFPDNGTEEQVDFWRPKNIVLSPGGIVGNFIFKHLTIFQQ